MPSFTRVVQQWELSSNATSTGQNWSRRALVAYTRMQYLDHRGDLGGGVRWTPLIVLANWSTCAALS